MASEKPHLRGKMPWSFLAMAAFLFVACDGGSDSLTSPDEDGSAKSSSIATPKSSSSETSVPSSSVKSSSSSVKYSSSQKFSSSSKKVQSSSSSQKFSSSSKKVQSSSSSQKFSSSSKPIQSSFSHISCSSQDANDEESSSSVAVCKTETEDNCEYGLLTDERDGQTYKTVKIGTQWWMAENLNYGDSVTTPSLKGNSWCYENDEEICAEAGRLYTWTAAVDTVKLANDADNPLDCSSSEYCPLPAKVQGICPDGWHLPSVEELTGWFNDHNGSDGLGFSVLPAGYVLHKYVFQSYGYRTYIWSSSQSYNSVQGRSSVHLSHNAILLYIDHADEYASLYNHDKIYGYSVRCLKD